MDALAVAVELRVVMAPAGKAMRAISHIARALPCAVQEAHALRSLRFLHTRWRLVHGEHP